MNNNRKYCPNSVRRRYNHMLYRQGGLRELKDRTGMWRIQSGMNNVSKPSA